MNTLGLTAYILIWPILSAGILIMLIVALIRDIRAARRENKEMV